MDFRDIVGGIRDVGSVLVKRGTAMGPLVPTLLLVPGFIFAAWLFRTIAVVWEIPIFSAVFVLVALAALWDYHRHYSAFAKNDPDRLQSEEYRIGMARTQMIAAKELPQPMPEDKLPLQGPESNPTQKETRTDDESSGSASEKATP